MNFGEASDARFLCELAGDAEDASWDGFFLIDTIMFHRDGDELVSLEESLKLLVLSEPVFGQG